jgi:Domain of unknown function (DUF4261)
MAKGMHTQGVAVLFERAPAAEQLARALGGFQIVRPLEGRPGDWMTGRFGLVLAMRPEVNGAALVQVFDQPWPDGMGDPETDPKLFGAWSLGHFGPFAYPGNLERAVAHAYQWDEAAATVARHRAFVRLTTTYVGGAAPDARIMPADYEPIAELDYLVRAAQAVLGLPGGLAYFNPNGEVVQPAELLDDGLAFFRENQLPPLPIWSNVRFFRIHDLQPWAVMDTVGMAQLDIDDHEACFPTDRYDPSEVADFLRNSTDYVRLEGPVIEDGNTMDGPGGVAWRAFASKRPMVGAPARHTLRWFPGELEIPKAMAPATRE